LKASSHLYVSKTHRFLMAN